MADLPTDLKSLEAPFIEERNAASELATLQSLHDTVPHEGARRAIQADLASAKARLTAAIKARQAHETSGVTQAMIDQAAQREIDARPAEERGR
jgi:hypothetical protein